MPRVCFLFPLLLLAACNAPTTPGPYPQNPAVSDAQGHPRDSTTFYFPAADSLHDKYLPKDKWPLIQHNTDIRLSNCASALEGASYNLTYFEAPVLSNYYLGADIYRFLWERSFHLPVLLTLHHDTIGTFIRTQLLDKYPGFYKHMLSHPYTLRSYRMASAEKKALLMRRYLEEVNSPRHVAEVAEGKRRAALITERETNLAVSPQQWQHFQDLLTQAQFKQLPACKPKPGMLDGSYWLLEAHQADSYHMAARQSPGKTDPFRQACEYLIDLSSVRGEERY